MILIFVCLTDLYKFTRGFKVNLEINLRKIA